MGGGVPIFFDIFYGDKFTNPTQQNAQNSSSYLYFNVTMYIPKCFDPQGTIFRESNRTQCRTKTNQPVFLHSWHDVKTVKFLWGNFSFKYVFPKCNSRCPYKHSVRTVAWFKNNPEESCSHLLRGGSLISLLRCADKSLARPGRKQANASVRMAWISFGALLCR